MDEAIVLIAKSDKAVSACSHIRGLTIWQCKNRCTESCDSIPSVRATGSLRRLPEDQMSCYLHDSRRLSRPRTLQRQPAGNLQAAQPATDTAKMASLSWFQHTSFASSNVTHNFFHSAAMVESC